MGRRPDADVSRESTSPASGTFGGCFATTHWTRVLAARGDSADARTALSELCGIYYEPVVAFLSARFREDDRARDLAHEFFRQLLERNSIQGVDPDRGRFRNYLLGAVKHFLIDRGDRDLAIKRGAGVEHLPLGCGTDTSPGLDPPAANERPAELEFDRQWAITLLARALSALAAEHDTPARRIQFEVLRPWLTGAGGSQPEAAARLGLNEGAVKVAIHRLRRRFRDLVKAEIAGTVNDPSEVAEEMNYLVTVLAG
jgi:DNA-directed RNA polymerase specialized sigma24 family protein